jgi:CHAT domain-containing protein
VELLALSACRTALGNQQAELGFAGLAVLAGAKSALASLWSVNDQGTLALMTDFYQQLDQAPIKAEALRRTQVAMLKGQVRLEGSKLRISDKEIPLPPELVQARNQTLEHPYYWSGFTMIGNPW